MKFFKALLFPFREPDWPGKLGLTILVAAIPFFGFYAIKGWQFEVSVRVRHREQNLLPGWRDPFGKFWRGLLIRFASFVYNLPTFLFLGAGLFLWGRMFVRFFSQDARTLEVFLQMLKQSLAPRVLLLLVAALLFSVLGSMLYWAGYLRYIDTRRYSVFLRVFENVRLIFKNVWDDLLMAFYLYLLSLVLGGLAGLLTTAVASTGVGAFLAPILVPALVFTITDSVKGYLLGQLALSTLGESPPAG